MNNNLLKAETLVECALVNLEKAALKETNHLEIIIMNQAILKANELLQVIGELDD